MKNGLLLVSFFSLFCLAKLRLALAATDDVAYNSCLKQLNQRSDVLRSNTWYNISPPPAIQKFENLYSGYGHIQRWTSHKNVNGTVTFIVLNRGNDLVTEDDPDCFDVFLQKRGLILYVDTFSASAEAFLTISTAGVNGIISCTQGDVGVRQFWNGHDWD